MPQMNDAARVLPSVACSRPPARSRGVGARTSRRDAHRVPPRCVTRTSCSAPAAAAKGGCGRRAGARRGPQARRVDLVGAADSLRTWCASSSARRSSWAPRALGLFLAALLIPGFHGTWPDSSLRSSCSRLVQWPASSGWSRRSSTARRRRVAGIAGLLSTFLALWIATLITDGPELRRRRRVDPRRRGRLAHHRGARLARGEVPAQGSGGRPRR